MELIISFCLCVYSRDQTHFVRLSQPLLYPLSHVSSYSCFIKHGILVSQTEQLKFERKQFLHKIWKVEFSRAQDISRAILLCSLGF